MYKNLREINAKYTKKGQQRKFGKKRNKTKSNGLFLFRKIRVMNFTKFMVMEITAQF